MIEATSTPLVNLESQLASIGNTLRRVLHTRGGNFLMIGGARGVGKSRLATAVGEKCEGEGMQVVSTQCLGRGAEPLLPIKEALQSYFGKTPESIRDVILRAAPVLLDEVPFVGRFLSRIGDELATGPKLGGEHPRGLYDALAQVLLEIGRHPGLCLIIHDLHLADEDTLYFLNYFVIKSKTSPTLTIATAPEGEWERPPLGDLFADWRAQGHDLLPLPPLNRVHAARFVSALFEGARPEHSTLQLLYKFTSGNPLFVAETVRLLVEAGHLSVREGAIHYDGAPLTVPPRIDFLLQHRIQRVTGPAFTFLQVAAVIAETTQELQPISHLLGVTEQEAYSLLATLTRVHLLIEQPDARLTFESELLRMAVSSGISVNYRH